MKNRTAFFGPLTKEWLAVINDVQIPYSLRPTGLDSMAVTGTNHASTNFLAGPFAAAKRGV